MKSSKFIKALEDLNPLVLIFSLIVIATVLTYVLPAGEFDRAVDPHTGRTAVVAGTYHTVEASDSRLSSAVLSFNKGIVSAASIISFLFLIGGAFGIVNSTGAVTSFMIWLVLKFRSDKSKHLLIILLLAFFEICGGTFGMSLESLVFVPFLMALTVKMGYDPLVGVALPIVGTNLGYASAYLNPFSLGIAQGIAELPFTSGIGLRIALMIAYLIVSAFFILRYAEMVKRDPSKSLCAEGSYTYTESDEITTVQFTTSQKCVLLTFSGAIILLVYGTMFLGFTMPQCSTVFLVMGILSGIFAKMSPAKIASEFISGVSGIVNACIIVGFANGINIILTDGKIMDTIIYYFTMPLQNLSPLICAPLMIIIQSLVNFFVSSGSAQAVVMMPLMVPIADLLEVNRQVAVLAYQVGDGLSNMIWLTSPIMLIGIGMAKVLYTKYLSFIIKIYLANLILSMVVISLAQALDWGPF